MALPPHPLLLLVPAPDTFPATSHNHLTLIQNFVDSLTLVEVLQFEALDFSSHASAIHHI